MILEIKKILQNQSKFDEDMMLRGEKIRAQELEMVYLPIRELETKIEELSREINEISKSSQAITEELREKSKRLDQERSHLELELEKQRKNFNHLLYSIPNWLAHEVPKGKDASENIVIYTSNLSKKESSDHHEDIAMALGLWGRKEATEMSRSRFMILTGKLAKLERSLAQFALNYLTNKNFIEMSVPYLVNKKAMFNTGQLPKLAGEYFELEDFCLIPTGEVPLVNFFASKTVQDLPIRVTACTPCFRKEAGSLGKDTKGLIRLHQFTKVEMVCITHEDKSAEMHLELLGHIKAMLELLGLHYRVVELCSGDIAFTANRQYDVEVWMPSQQAYVEVASCSNCLDFQARRMKTNYVDLETKQRRFVHTLNATGLACGRIIAAILENYCTSSEFRIPEVLSSI